MMLLMLPPGAAKRSTSAIEDGIADYLESLGRHDIPEPLPQNWSMSGWQAPREFIFERDGKVCRLCGATEHLAIDHIEPTSKVPQLAMIPSNLQVLCRSCNARKGATWT